MDLTEDWKTQFAIGRVPNAPLLVSASDRAKLGPLFLNPKPYDSRELLSSPSLSPPVLFPIPRLSLRRFLRTSSLDCPLLPSDAVSIAKEFGPQRHEQNSNNALISHNRLQLLPCPDKRSAVVFFPTGSDLDHVGYVIVSVKESDLCCDDVLKSEQKFNMQIVKILVNPVEIEKSSSASLVRIGFLMAYTLYSVHWYRIEFCESEERVVLQYLGTELFKSSISSACWSPHFPYQCLVLLENGALFFFDLETGNKNIRGKKIISSWEDDISNSSQKCNYIGCEFSLDSRICIVARSDAAFIVDWSSGRCSVSCVTKIKELSKYASIKKEWFHAFTIVPHNRCQFVLASRSLVFLCDIRSPNKPLLQWGHLFDQLKYAQVFKLSDLRSGSSYESTDSGSCIILGSFWSSRFLVFTYGPFRPEDCETLYAWDIPYSLSLSGRECRCGDCVLKEQFWKDSLHDWVCEQQKKVIVLGFGVLNKYIALSDLSEFGGCTIIRLLSSGKLEAQKYTASFTPAIQSEISHRDSKLLAEDNTETLLFTATDEECNFKNRFRWLYLDYLYAHINCTLVELVDSKMRKLLITGMKEKGSFSLEYHEILCKKLKVCGFGRERYLPAVSVVYNNISMPTIVAEMALTKVWINLPIELQLFAFTSYSDINQVFLNNQSASLEFSLVSDKPRLPPFFLKEEPSNRSSKWTRKVQQLSDASLVGPAFPHPVLLTVHELCNGGCPNSQEESDCFSPDKELSHHFDEILKAGTDMAGVEFGSKEANGEQEEAVCLDDDREKIWTDPNKVKMFLSYPAIGNPPSISLNPSEKKFVTVVTKIEVNRRKSASSDWENLGLTMFDDLCPTVLEFDNRELTLGSEVVENFGIFKKQYSLWHESENQYQEFLTTHL